MPRFAYTAIDASSSFMWAELHASARNPSARFTSQLAHRVAAAQTGHVRAYVLAVAMGLAVLAVLFLLVA